jgi:hypothetical protein
MVLLMLLLCLVAGIFGWRTRRRQARCLADEACYAPLLGRQLVGFANESEAVEAATRSVLSTSADINL